MSLRARLAHLRIMPALIALATVSGLTVAAAQPANEPLPGQVFIYSDGRVERFMREDGDKRIWATRAGRMYTRVANPILPIQDWEIGDRRGGSQVHGEAGSLWPPEKGRRAQFRVLNIAQTGARESRSVQAWTCRVGTVAPVRTHAGVFDAYPVNCDLYSVGSMRLLEKRTWWWAPELGHYVRRKYQSLRTGKISDIQLCAALPDTRATGARIDALLKSC